MLIMDEKIEDQREQVNLYTNFAMAGHSLIFKKLPQHIHRLFIIVFGIHILHQKFIHRIDLRDGIINLGITPALVDRSGQRRAAGIQGLSAARIF